MRRSTPLPPIGRLERRSILLGVLISLLLAVAIVVAGLKAGITPGVSPLVVLLAWALFARSLHGNNAHLLLNQAQVAGSAGAAVSAGVIFTAPLLPILSHAQGLPYHGLPLWKLMGACFSGALIGYGYVGLNARRILADASLPAPEARACAAMVEVATHDVAAQSSTNSEAAALPSDAAPNSVQPNIASSQKPRLSRSLIPGMLHGFGASLLATLGLASAQLSVLSLQTARNARAFEIKLPYIPLYFGIGGLLSLGTAIAVFLGTGLRLFFDWLLLSKDLSPALWPDTSLRWLGGGAMTVAVAWSIAALARKKPVVEDSTEDQAHLHTLAITTPQRRRLIANIALGTLLLLSGILIWSGLSVFSVSLAVAVTFLAAFMVALGALLSLQIGSSASPVSGAIFLMTLALCSIALLAGRGQTAADLELMTLVLVAACVAVCASNDTSQDYRTLQLCDVPISRAFGGQWLGLMSACIAVPITIVLAEKAYGLGSAALPAPQGQLFATLAEGLLFERALPWYPIGVGVIIGVIAVVLEVISRPTRLWISAMALAVGLYLPPELGVGLLLGALARYAGDRGKAERSESLLSAGGLITGGALFDLVFGVAMLAGVSADALHIFDLPRPLPALFAALGIFAILRLLYRSARGKGHASTP